MWSDTERNASPLFTLEPHFCSRVSPSPVDLADGNRAVQAIPQEMKTVSQPWPELRTVQSSDCVTCFHIEYGYTALNIVDFCMAEYLGTGFHC